MPGPVGRLFMGRLVVEREAVEGRLRGGWWERTGPRAVFGVDEGSLA